MRNRFFLAFLTALFMIIGVATASASDTSSDSASASWSVVAMPESTGSCGFAAEAADYTPGVPGGESTGVSDTGESSNPCDTACECCGLWNVPSCCDKCWSCWYNS